MTRHDPWNQRSACTQLKLRLWAAIWLACLAGVSAVADGPQPLLREIFVPFEDLNVVLQQGPRRVYLAREEYEDLLARAARAAQVHSQQPAAIVEAVYDALVETGRARIRGSLVVDVPSPGLQTVELDLSGLAVRSCRLDGAGAPLGLDSEGRHRLFVTGPGRRRLELELLVPVSTSAAMQTLQCRLPTPPATRLRLTVPGSIEVRSGAQVVSREVDAGGEFTRLELLPQQGEMALVMSLNNRQLQEERALVARGVIIDEVTPAYERLHATVSFSVLFGAVERLRLLVPAGFEVTDCDAPEIAVWSVQPLPPDVALPIELPPPEPGVPPPTVLEARLREPARGRLSLNIRAVRSAAALDAWELPRLIPLETAGQVAVVGLLADTLLAAEAIRPQGLFPIDTGVLAHTLPVSLVTHDHGPPLVPVAAYYAPQPQFSLRAAFRRPPARLHVTTNVLLTLADSGLHVRGGVALLPAVEKLFSFELNVPAGWQVSEVTGEGGEPLAFEPVATADGNPRLRIKLGTAVPPGETRRVYFQAASTPEAWYGGWNSTTLAFPAFTVPGAASEAGALAVATQDDLLVRPEAMENLTPLDEADKARWGLEGVSTDLAYRYDAVPYSATLAVERELPRVTARAWSFVRVDADSLAAHYELAFDVTAGRTRRVSFLLPEQTPTALALAGQDGLVIREFYSEAAEGARRWVALLDQPRSGRIRLAVDFEQPLPPSRLADLALPLPQAEAVAYQSGLVAVETSAELDVMLLAHPRKVDVGELVDAQYLPGKRLLGAFAYVGPPAEVRIRAERPSGYALPLAIVQRAELATVAASAGQAQTAARFLLRTKADVLELRLPAGSVLWSAHVDGKASAPARQQGSLLISLPAVGSDRLRDVQFVFATPTPAVGAAGTLVLEAPRLHVRSGEQSSEEVPLADLVWHVYVPTGMQVVSNDGTVFLNRPLEPSSPAWRVVEALWALGNRIRPLHWLSAVSTRQAGRPLERDARARYAASPGVARSEESVGAALDEAAEEGASEAHEDIAGELARDSDLPQRPAPRSALKGEARRETEAMDEADSAAAADQGPEQAEGAEPPSTETPPEAGEERTAGPARQAASPDWALEGVRSLKIDIDQSGSLVTLESLGAEPRLELSMVDGRRLQPLAWGVAAAVLLAGLAITRRSAAAKQWLVLSVLAVSGTLPIVAGWSAEAAQPCDLAFYAAALLVPYYLAVAAARRVGNWNARRHAERGLAALVLAGMALGALASGQAALAQGPQQSENQEHPLPPVQVPEDAVLIPYDPTDPDGWKRADKLLIPYDKYVELWNLAHPERRLTEPEPPADFALAGSRYELRLLDAEDLVVAGDVELQVFVDRLVSVPLALAGAVISEATLDGQPARLSVALPAGDTQQPLQAQQGPQAQGGGERWTSPQQPQGAAGARAALPEGAVFLVHLTGRGSHRLQLSMRVRAERRGGWRRVQVQLPAAIAAALDVVVPQAGTELRLGAATTAVLETARPDERVESVLGGGGLLSLEWRPHVAAAAVDQSLTARSRAVFDVQEDGLRLAWQLTLEFRRAQRETFDLLVPAGYLVEGIEGSNIRGWKTAAAGPQQRLTVDLLEPARDQESFTVRLSRLAHSGPPQLEPISVPQLAVEAAALQEGELLIRRSTLVELRTVSSSGVARTDISPELAAQTHEISPLGLLPYEAYRFQRVPFELSLAGRLAEERNRAALQTVLRIAERDRSAETRISLQVLGRPVYQVAVAIPQEFEVEEVAAPGRYQWSVEEQAEQKRLTVLLAAGQAGTFELLIRGRLGQPGAAAQVLLPRFEVLGAETQEGELVVEADPALDIRPAELQGCEPVLLGTVLPWLAEEQQPLARLAFRHRGAAYGGTLALSARQPRIVARTVINLRVTDRAVEETILIDYTIREAGTRELVFLLPQALREARISVPLLRQKFIEPAVGQEAMLRVRLELQDDVAEQVRVLIEHDRALSPGPQHVPFVTLVGATHELGFVALESAGRDEVVVDETAGIEPLLPAQREWQALAALLPGNLTQAWLWRPGPAQPSLRFHVQDRNLVETAGARIGLAETVLVLDAAGAFRAQQTYWVDNRTEQYLELALPAGVVLWSARVAGEAVKPALMPANPALAPSGEQVRIPLVKTAEGERDFQVVIKYGGKLASLHAGARVSFPLVRTVNIQVELSQVRLWLPPDFRWLAFGGSMRRVEDPAELEAGLLSYRRKELERLASVAERSPSQFGKVRASSFVAACANDLQQLAVQLQGRLGNAAVRLEHEAAQRALQQAAQLQQAANEYGDETLLNNRDQLLALFRDQHHRRARDLVHLAGENWTAEHLQAAAAGAFDLRWLANNALAGSPTETFLLATEAAPPGKSRAADKDRLPADLPAAPEVVREEERQQVFEDTKKGGERSGGSLDDTRHQLRRYQQRLAQQQAPAQTLDDAEPSNGPGSTQPYPSQGGYAFGAGRLPAGMAGGGGQAGELGAPPGADAMPPGDVADQQVLREGREEAAASAPPTASLGMAPPAGSLASLDVELARRGTEFLFTTPRGDIEITARPLPQALLDRGSRLAGLLLLLAAGLAAYRLAGPVWRAIASSRLLTWLLLLASLAAWCGGLLPLYALIAFGMAATLLVRQVFARRKTHALTVAAE
ncbi:MAG: hypothetical protein K6T86_01200 [Pirellulales bacterium]|nr:hypothetical protein [Pirellulales bacterium]